MTGDAVTVLRIAVVAELYYWYCFGATAVWALWWLNYIIGTVLAPQRFGCCGG
ncbi:MAG: hypothetical protein K6G64_02165 [Eubacterium sp.]|nr:hypothetical protein [Eubacterium sp.]